MKAGGNIHAINKDGHTIGHCATRSSHARCLRTWIHAGGDIHAVDRMRWTIGHMASLAEDDRCLRMWIAYGGNIHDGCRHDDLMARVSSLTGKHPCIHVTKASISLMKDGSIPTSYRAAFHDPRGRALAERMVPAFTDPIQMGIWIQAIGENGSG
jgi:ankyrin repeat protein